MHAFLRRSPGPNHPALCLILLAVIFSPTVSLYAANPLALSVVNDTSSASLLNALLLPGTGITVTSAVRASAPLATGRFMDSPQGIANGIVMATGRADEAAPASPTLASYSHGIFGCPECDALLSPTTSHDAAKFTIVFDATPSCTAISIDFVFASEHYPDWYGTQYADAFGMYLNGTQFAFVSGNPVTSNTPLFGTPGVQLPATTQLRYNAATGVVTATIPVTPGSTNNQLLIAICDGLDNIWDSGVLLARLRGEVASCCIGETGNVNKSVSETPDISDLSLLIAYLVNNPKPVLPCLEEANVNGSVAVNPDLSDLSLLIAYLTTNPKPVLAPCP